LKAERKQVEHQPDLLIEVLELTDGRVGHVDAFEVPRASHGHPAFELANGVEIVRQLRLVARAEIVTKCLGSLIDHVQDAGVLA
jgi:hypothetical protein